MDLAGHTIWVVDDDAILRRALGRLLRARGFNVELFSEGGQFLQSLALRRPHCVILDVNLGQASGLDLLQHPQVRALQLPVIMITGNEDPAIREQAKAGGAIELLLKPFEERLLMTAVCAALEKNQSERTMADVLPGLAKYTAGQDSEMRAPQPEKAPHPYPLPIGSREGE
ncbi:MAG TPA: response regulator [Candidatus Dormibacteraeota bacterium]|nr:response regulator [Candidatus Dormibacteraeota bacterium]